jgi:DNA-binding protein YbaB
MSAFADDASGEQIAQLLKARKVENVTIAIGNATVTVSANLELLSISLTGPGVLEDHRDALQRDIVAATNLAMQEVALASARAFEALQRSPQFRAIRDDLEKRMG